MLDTFRSIISCERCHERRQGPCCPCRALLPCCAPGNTQPAWHSTACAAHPDGSAGQHTESPSECRGGSRGGSHLQAAQPLVQGPHAGPHELREPPAAATPVPAAARPLHSRHLVLPVQGFCMGADLHWPWDSNNIAVIHCGLNPGPVQSRATMLHERSRLYTSMDARLEQYPARHGAACWMAAVPFRAPDNPDRHSDIDGLPSGAYTHAPRPDMRTSRRWWPADAL